MNYGLQKISHFQIFSSNSRRRFFYKTYKSTLVNSSEKSKDLSHRQSTTGSTGHVRNIEGWKRWPSLPRRLHAGLSQMQSEGVAYHCGNY